MVHFWANHFAVSADKLTTIGMAGLLEFEAIRPHVLGRFEDMLFAVDSASLNATLVRDIQSVGASLVKYPNSTIQVVGHTDNTGAAAYNKDLSLRRAGAVAHVLVGSGVPSSRIQSIGAGEDRPIASNLTPEGRAQNRRVEIIIRPTR